MFMCLPILLAKPATNANANNDVNGNANSNAIYQDAPGMATSFTSSSQELTAISSVPCTTTATATATTASSCHLVTARTLRHSCIFFWRPCSLSAAASAATRCLCSAVAFFRCGSSSTWFKTSFNSPRRQFEYGRGLRGRDESRSKMILAINMPGNVLAISTSLLSTNIRHELVLCSD
eukprot:6181603-Pleurochrysis_carterae.AAC.1